jgi:IS30 family transposase
MLLTSLDFIEDWPIRRNYRPKQAHHQMMVIMTQIKRLEMKWSPEQISNRLRLEGEESFYKFISAVRVMETP